MKLSSHTYSIIL